MPERDRTSIIASAALTLALAGLLSACGEQSSRPDDAKTPFSQHTGAPVVAAGEALSAVHIPTIDPSVMVEAEVAAVIESKTRCEFRYTTAGRPVFAISPDPEAAAASGVVKVNGNLVVFEKMAEGGENPQASGSYSFSAGPMQINLRIEEAEPWSVQEGVRRKEAEMLFRIGDRLEAGYRGYFDCGDKLPQLSYEH